MVLAFALMLATSALAGSNSTNLPGGAALTVSVDDPTTSKPLPLPGADDLTYETTAPGLAPGDHELCVTANGSDTIGTASVPQCEVIHLYQLTLAPDGVVNELGTPGQGHEVMATLLGPLGGLAPVGGRTIDFAVVGGPNTGAAGSDTTDANGDASFSYTATQGPAGLGTDTIEACVTLNDPLGETGCTSVSKDWVDTTPPVPACMPSVNPGGNEPKAPGQGGQGQNQDGFYELLAEDAVWPPEDLMIYVVDTGSGTVWGSFPVGTNIKYTEANGAPPKIKEMASDTDAVDFHIIGNGDAAVYAVDGSDNQSDPVFCLVPPPPK
jgi:hypothetical protein